MGLFPVYDKKLKKEFESYKKALEDGGLSAINAFGGTYKTYADKS